MPKTHNIMNKLPKSLQIEYVVGPLQIRRCGNGGHVLVPCKFIGKEKTYVVICKDEEKRLKIFDY